MRKHQQKQILQLLTTIKEAQSAHMYADCQDGAISAGEFIESIKGEGTRTVALLEDYCELLYKASIGEIGEKALQKQLTAIENSVKNELKPNRIEIAFLSYKASMSDCIESIYLAAKADPNCDAYWIPIPYYDLNAGGTVGEMHYEGADFYSEDFECTSWQEYDIESRHPDVIFTFNPYDSSNYVTSVHPSFYCKRLRDLTDMLVYVPYFVLTDDNVPENFLISPGCLYAHKVIAQSEKIRDVYVRVLKESYGSRFGRPEDRFIALGSPKYDKVINSKREDYTLPDKWVKKIGNKKTLLYNTTVSSILAGDEQYLKKLRFVIDTFRNHDDIVLWWRPHPLSEATYASMRPQLLSEYEQIISEYKDEGFGIYDDTPDLHRALAWTDAYYGDWSSLVTMYHATGKPVMIQDNRIISELEPSNTFVFFADDGNDLWFSSLNFNALFKLNLVTWQAEFVGSFPNEEARPNLFHKPTKNGGNIYFPPFYAEKIGVYSITDRMFQSIPYHDLSICDSTESAFSEATVYDDNVYFAPHMYPAIVRFNTLTTEITYYSEWLEPLKTMITDVQDGYLSYPAIVGSTMMLPAFGKNAVVEFDMATQKSVVHEVGKKSNRYVGICHDGESFWLSPLHNTPVVKWNPFTGETTEVTVLCRDEEDTQYALHHGIYCGGYIWMLPRFAQTAYKIDINTDNVSIAEEFELDYADEMDKAGMKYQFCQVLGDSIFAYNVKKGTVVELNCRKKERREEKISYSIETLEQIDLLLAKLLIVKPEAMQSQADCFYYETATRLRDYANNLVLLRNSSVADAMTSRRKEIARALNKNADGTAGFAIYEYIRTAVLSGR